MKGDLLVTVHLSQVGLFSVLILVSS